MQSYIEMSGSGSTVLTNIYTAVLVKSNNWPSSVHCKALIVGWEAAAGTLEVAYTAMCSMLPTIAKGEKRSQGDVVSYRGTECVIVRP
jgi:hypothetical protein